MANNWLHSSPYAPLPPNAVVGGYDSDGSPIYVGRSFHEGDNLPTKVIPSKRKAFIPWGGAEHSKDHYEILVGENYSWQPCFGATVPPNAISTGKTSSGEPLYVGRGHYANSLAVGKVQPSHGCIYIPFDGTEVKLEKYEILVYGGAGVDPNGSSNAAAAGAGEGHTWVHSSAFSCMPPNAVVGGNDYDGDMIYVGRAFHNGDMLVVKVVPSKQMGFASWRGEELRKDHFEVLCGRSLVWRHCYNHVIPDNAVLCGTTSLDQAVYIGRGHYEGSLSVGRISKVHRALFIPYKGVEKRLETYEILVEEKLSAGWKIEVSTDPLPPPPPLTPETVCPYPLEKATGVGFLEIKPAMPMPTPIDPPPPYTPTAMPMPMPSAMNMPRPMPMPSPMPMPTVTPTPAQVYVPPPTADAGGYKPAYNYSTPAQNYPTPAQNYPGPPPVLYHTSPPRHYEKWIPASPPYTPGNAVHAGHDSDMSTIYVCRAYHNGNVIPGKAVPSRSCAYVPYEGQEIYKTNYEILVGEHYIWVPAINGYAVGAVEGGRTVSGEVMFVGRAHYHGSLTCGKIQPTHGCLYIPYGGRQVRIEGNYEILVRRDEYYRGQGSMY